MPFSRARPTLEPIGTTLMLSTPAATTRSWVPDSTPWAAKWTACWEDPHCRSMVTPGTPSGSPADSQAFLAMSMDCGPTCETQPMMTSSTADGSAPVRVISSDRTWAARSPGCTPDTPPFRRPTGVRTAPTMYASDTMTSTSARYGSEVTPEYGRCHTPRSPPAGSAAGDDQRPLDFPPRRATKPLLSVISRG